MISFLFTVVEGRIVVHGSEPVRNHVPKSTEKQGNIKTNPQFPPAQVI
jgi:hypothetical protein